MAAHIPTPTLPLYEAEIFHLETMRGQNKPFRVTAIEKSTGKREKLIVKARAGYQEGEVAMLKECFCLLLCQEWDIPCPTPVIVELAPGFEYGALDRPDRAEIIKKSHGLNFATIDLGRDWKTWTDTNQPKKLPKETIADIYAFDALVQNQDRHSDNPNLLWRGEEVVALDYDCALGYFGKTPEARLWRRFLPLLHLDRHCLHRFLPKLSKKERFLAPYLMEKVEAGVAGLPLNLSKQALAMKAEEEFDFAAIIDYLMEVFGDAEDFFGYLTQLSFPKR